MFVVLVPHSASSFVDGLQAIRARSEDAPELLIGELCRLARSSGLTAAFGRPSEMAFEPEGGRVSLAGCRE